MKEELVSCTQSHVAAEYYPIFTDDKKNFFGHFLFFRERGFTSPAFHFLRLLAT